MKKPIGKARRKRLNAFLNGPRTGLQASLDLWNGILPYSTKHPQSYNHWVNTYYGVYYGNDAKRYALHARQLTDDDIKYIESLVNIDPFLSSDENKEFLVE